MGPYPHESAISKDTTSSSHVESAIRAVIYKVLHKKVDSVRVLSLLHTSMDEEQKKKTVASLMIADCSEELLEELCAYLPL